MSATATFGPSVGGKSDNRVLAWLAAIGLLVSLLTSETLWAFWLDTIGAEDNAYADPDALPVPVISEREKQQLISLTEDPVPQNRLTPIEATELNAAIPFAANAVVGARPFQLFGQRPETGLTALKCLTQAVYHEAAYEPLAGRRAVAQVVLNRMRHPAFPNSVCGVVYQGVNKPLPATARSGAGSIRRPGPRQRWSRAMR
jgi:spore germination cell wall hydrolase CwlJ-like protein